MEDSANSFNHIVRKDESYMHENEVRAVIWHPNQPEHIVVQPNSVNNEYPQLSPANEGGINVQVDVSTLICEVIVGPREPTWVVDLVKNVTELYGYSCPIRKSDKLTKRSEP